MLTDKMESRGLAHFVCFIESFPFCFCVIWLNIMVLGLFKPFVLHVGIKGLDFS